jgi:hypothetical protein
MITDFIVEDKFYLQIHSSKLKRNIMKNFTLFLLSIFCMSGSAFAQPISNITAYPSSKSILSRNLEASDAINSLTSGYRTSIYSETFDSGLPNEWIAETVSGPCSWAWTDIGHQGDFPSDPLESTTASNGWMILDSDYCNWDGGGFELNYLTSPSIDCSGYNAVSIRFEQYFRAYLDDVTAVEVSNDGGSTWTTFEINVDVGFEGTPNPDIVQINITAFAANQPNVKVRFRWEGTWEYGWQIDDFALIVPVDNDLSISNTGFQDVWISLNEDNMRDLEYSIYPISQVREMNFIAQAHNYGALVQTGVALQVNVNDGAGYNQTLTSSTASILPGESYDFSIPYTPPGVVGDYNITYTIIQNEDDEFTDNNTASGSFGISQGVYARDLGVSTGYWNSFINDYKYGTSYYMDTDETIHCVGVALSNQSNQGTPYNIEIRQVEGDDFYYVAESELAVVPPINQLNDIGGSEFIWLAMETPTALSEGVDYCVLLQNFGGSNSVKISLSGTSPPFSSFYYEGAETTWYYTESTPMIRMGLSASFCASVVESLEIYGCTDPLALNFNPQATIDDGSCEYNPLECQVSYELIPDTIGSDVIWVMLSYSSGGDNQFHWDFGDGNESLETYPSHTYVQAGDYLVCVTLNVTDGFGGVLCTDVFCDTISSDILSGLVERPIEGHRQNGFTINIVNPTWLSVSETEVNNSFSLFPNPSTGLLNVRYSGGIANSSTIQFYDISGRQLQSETIPVLNEGQQLVFDISHLPAGIYFVSIESASGRETHKLLKQ